MDWAGENTLELVSTELSRAPFLEELFPELFVDFNDFFLFLCDLDEELVSEFFDLFDGDPDLDLFEPVQESRVSGGVQPRDWSELETRPGKLGTTSCERNRDFNMS